LNYFFDNQCIKKYKNDALFKGNCTICTENLLKNIHIISRKNANKITRSRKKYIDPLICSILNFKNAVKFSGVTNKRLYLPKLKLKN